MKLSSKQATKQAWDMVFLVLLWAMLVASMVVSDGIVSYMAQGTMLLLIVVHALEFMYAFSILKEDTSRMMIEHCFLTILFGMVHWQPIEKAIKRRNKKK